MMTTTAPSVDVQSLGSFVDGAAQRLQDGDFSAVFGVVEADLEESTAQLFAAEKSPDGLPWADRKDNKPHPILRLTGRLWGSVAASDPPYAVREQYDAGATKVFVFGTDAPYAKFHQDGTSKMPARPFLGWTPETRSRAIDLVVDRAIQLVLGSRE